MRYCDGNGALTAAERNRSLADAPRRNYSRRKQRLPYAQRLERLKKHFDGTEHFAGAEYPPPKPFDMETRDFQHAVLMCVFQQKLSVGDTAALTGATVSEVEIEIDIIRQNAE